MKWGLLFEVCFQIVPASMFFQGPCPLLGKGQCGSHRGLLEVSNLNKDCCSWHVVPKRPHLHVDHKSEEEWHGRFGCLPGLVGRRIFDLAWQLSF